MKGIHETLSSTRPPQPTTSSASYLQSRHHEEQGQHLLVKGCKFNCISRTPTVHAFTNFYPVQKIRQSWSKYNLYNLQRFRAPATANRTFFQQKWTAKATARAYHGEQVREGQWKRMFSKRIRSVIPMNTTDLAADDGSKESDGRGSGLTESGGRNRSRLIPYTQMAFAPLERRLDVAIFRALFASSTRQARQFVIHGAVTVNGQKVK